MMSEDAIGAADELEAVLQGADGEGEGVEPGAGEADPQLDENGDPIEGEPPVEDDDSEDVEHEGKTFKAPKGIKEALLRQADYTRKTQEVADQKRELETGRQALIQQATAHREMLADVAKVVGLNDQLAAFDKYTPADWQKAHAADPDATQGIWMQYQQLRDSRDRAANALQAKERARLDAEQRTQRQAVEQRDAVLTRDIKGWSSETSGKLADFAEKEFGISKAEVAAATDPRFVKVLHRAMANTEAQKSQAKAANLAKAQATTPAKSLPGKSAPAAKDPDKMSMDEWVAYERRRMAAKAASGR